MKDLQLGLTVESVREAKKVKLKRFTKHDRVTLYWEGRAKTVFNLTGKIGEVLSPELLKAINFRTSYQCENKKIF